MKIELTKDIIIKAGSVFDDSALESQAEGVVEYWYGIGDNYAAPMKIAIKDLKDIEGYYNIIHQESAIKEKRNFGDICWVHHCCKIIKARFLGFNKEESRIAVFTEESMEYVLYPYEEVFTRETEAKDFINNQLDEGST